MEGSLALCISGELYFFACQQLVQRQIHFAQQMQQRRVLIDQLVEVCVFNAGYQRERVASFDLRVWIDDALLDWFHGLPSLGGWILCVHTL
jgi:hypothetical protein